MSGRLRAAWKEAQPFSLFYPGKVRRAVLSEQPARKDGRAAERREWRNFKEKQRLGWMRGKNGSEKTKAIKEQERKLLSDWNRKNQFVYRQKYSLNISKAVTTPLSLLRRCFGSLQKKI